MFHFIRKTKEVETESARPTFWGSIKTNLAEIHRLVPSMIPLYATILVLERVRPFITMIFSAKIVDLLIEHADRQTIMKYVCIMALGMLAVQLVLYGLYAVNRVIASKISDTKNAEIAYKTMTMDYEVLERNSTQKNIEKANSNTDAMGGFSGYLGKVSTLIGSCCSCIAAIVTMAGAFTVFTAQSNLTKGAFFASPISSIILLLLVVFSVLMNGKTEARIGEIRYKADQVNALSNRAYWFFFNMMQDYRYGKDIRIFHMRNLIEQKGAEARNEIEEVEKTTIRTCLRVGFGSLCLQNIFILAAYIFVGMKALYGMISIGDLTKYVSAITLLQGEFSSLLTVIVELRTHNMYLESYHELLGTGNEKYEGTIPVEKRLDHEYVLEFRNVSFHYPNNERMILKNVSVKIDSGEKLAIVGANGAGKTTFIKLICRLYDPTEGEILLNGIDIRKYDYDEYIRLFSVVFQDYKIFSFSVGENVAAGPEFDEELVIKSLKEAGIYERVQEMRGGINARLLKDQQDGDEEGIEISGGEKQKIALARALYRNAPMVILDEPTSALDPIAEQDIYMRFHEMVQEKTALFISHRMSSCRFCSRVIVFDDGQIVESGTHAELASIENGIYRKMWEAQAHYYV